MNAVVLGNGRSGKAAAELLAGEGWNVRVLDGDDAWPAGAADLCVASPGVPLDHPWQAVARAAGVKVVSELQLGAMRYRAAGGRMLAVTGSKGKSSVVKLVADALGGIPCGNYGKPLCEVVSENLGTDPLPVAVAEVSSFQMETTDLPPDAFEAAAVLNLQEDHLDRHGTKETYHALKRKLLDFSNVRIFGAGNCGGTDPSGDGNDVDGMLISGSYFDNPVLRENGRCAVALMRAAGLADEAIRNAFLRFEALPHRMQKVGDSDGVAYIDDSKATSISALAAGVAMAASFVSGCGRPASGSPKIRLIAGGLPKGDDPLAVRGCLAEHVAKAYLIGQCASAFADAWSEVVPCEACGTLDRAVACAKRDSCAGDIVLLSPGTASFDQFRSYAERGDAFKALVVGDAPSTLARM